jgi:5-deoxy-glucuronate isomerase
MPDEPFEGRPSTNWHYPARSTGSGAETVRVTPEHAGWGHTGLRVVELAPGASYDLATGEDEVVVLPLAGSCVVDAPFGHAELAGRPSVFEALTDYAYLPRDSPARLASAGGGRFALASARARRRLPFRHVGADQVQVELRGAGTCSRQVNNFATPGVLDADRLIACEVLTPAGNWSSYPPHKHDEQRAGENELEEIYYFEVNSGPGGPGLAYQRAYGTAERPADVLAEVRTGDVVIIPHGWHGPSIAAPGYDLYYLNVMAGPGPREWLVCFDPAHSWVRESWSDQPLDPRLPMTVLPTTGGGQR